MVKGLEADFSGENEKSRGDPAFFMVAASS
jgi:hypothetical protein